MQRRFVTAFALACLAARAVSAHPHTYIDAELGIDVGPAGVEGLRFRWAPLRNFGAEIAALYDRDGDGRFDPQETEAIRADAFASIEAYHYFIHIDVDGVAYRPASIEGFSVQLGGGQPYFSFSVPCRIAASSEPCSVTVSMRDETSYVSFALRYVDDGMDPAVVTEVDLTRDGLVYSHGSDFGNLDCTMTFWLADPTAGQAGFASRSAVSGLVPDSILPPVPVATHTNPFVKPGLRLDAASSANPFYGSSLP